MPSDPRQDRTGLWGVGISDGGLLRAGEAFLRTVEEHDGPVGTVHAVCPDAMTARCGAPIKSVVRDVDFTTIGENDETTGFERCRECRDLIADG